MFKYCDRAELVKLIAHCHCVESGGQKRTRVFKSERRHVKKAIGRATVDFHNAHRANSRKLWFQAVARFAVGIGNGFDRSADTAFLCAEYLLLEVGFRIQSNRPAIRRDFERAVQSRRETDVIHLLEQHWQLSR